MTSWQKGANHRSLANFQSTEYKCFAAGGNSHYPQLSEQAQQSSPGWQGLDNGGFDEVPLGSPPLKPGKAVSNGTAPHLDKVASSLRAYSEADEATKLHTENASLKQRLAAIENVSASVQAHSVHQSSCELLQTCIGALSLVLNMQLLGCVCCK